MLRHGIELEISDKLSEYNQQLIKKYWECENKTLRYKYSIQSLTNRYKFCNEDECEKYIARHSSVIITDERICCSSCGKRIIVKLRQELNIAFEKGFKFEYLNNNDIQKTRGFAQHLFLSDMNIIAHFYLKNLLLIPWFPGSYYIV